MQDDGLERSVVLFSVGTSMVTTLMGVLIARGVLDRADAAMVLGIGSQGILASSALTPVEKDAFSTILTLSARSLQMVVPANPDRPS